MTITGTGAQTLIQAAVDARMRGRVMALYGMIFRAGPAVGALVMGLGSEYLGLRLPLAMRISSGWKITSTRCKAPSPARNSTKPRNSTSHSICGS